LNTQEWLPWLLVAQGVMGGFDTLFNHELLVGLPRRPEAHAEIGLHWIREGIYGLLFIGVAWFAWEGSLALVIAGLLAVLLVVDLRDELVENRIRVLPQNERAVHALLTVNMGVIIAVVAVTVHAWSGAPTGLAPADHGLATWILSALGAASLGWSMRDFMAWRRLRRASGLAVA
jgi:hypothetical protein